MTKFVIAILCALVTGLAEADESTSEPEAGVTKCYKCEGDCNGNVGKVEGCFPDPGDTFKYVCYKSVEDGKVYQRGCTRDFSDGEECVDQNGRTYCFCRKDECNRSSLPTRISRLFVLGVTLISFQRFLRELWEVGSTGSYPFLLHQ